MAWRSVLVAVVVFSGCEEPCLVPGEYDFFATGLAPDFREVSGTFVTSAKEATLTTSGGEVRCTVFNVDDARGSPSHVCIIYWECAPSPSYLRAFDTVSGDGLITGGSGMFGSWTAARRSP